MDTEGFWKLRKNIKKKYLKQQEIRRRSRSNKKLEDEAEGIQLKKKKKK